MNPSVPLLPGSSPSQDASGQEVRAPRGRAYGLHPRQSSQVRTAREGNCVGVQVAFDECQEERSDERGTEAQHDDEQQRDDPERCYPPGVAQRSRRARQKKSHLTSQIHIKRRSPALPFRCTSRVAYGLLPEVGAFDGPTLCRPERGPWQLLGSSPGSRETRSASV